MHMQVYGVSWLVIILVLCLMKVRSKISGPNIYLEAKPYFSVYRFIFIATLYDVNHELFYGHNLPRRGFLCYCTEKKLRHFTFALG